MFAEIEQVLADNFYKDWQMGEVIEYYYDAAVADGIAELKKKYIGE